MDDKQPENGVPTVADELSVEVSIRAQLDDTGLTVAGKSRALSAVDRLFGGLVGWPASAVEGVRRRSELRNRVREEVIRVEGERAIEALRSMDSLGEAAAHRLIAQERRKQRNLEGVWGETKQVLQNLPAPEEGEPKISDQDSVELNELDEDWLNIFSSHAERASSERLQQMWGRILAGEIRKPSSFSPRTLRFIAELDAETAQVFQEAARLRVANRLLRPDSPLAGKVLSDLAMLDQAGLIEGLHASLNTTLADIGGARYLAGGEYVLKITAAPTATVLFPAIPLTKVGREIASILPYDAEAAFRRVASKIQGGDQIELCRNFAKSESEKLDLLVLEVLRPATES